MVDLEHMIYQLRTKRQERLFAGDSNNSKSNSNDINATGACSLSQNKISPKPTLRIFSDDMLEYCNWNNLITPKFLAEHVIVSMDSYFDNFASIVRSTSNPPDWKQSCIDLIINVSCL